MRVIFIALGAAAGLEIGGDAAIRAGRAKTASESSVQRDAPSVTAIPPIVDGVAFVFGLALDRWQPTP
jgi:hypothetical protein